MKKVLFLFAFLFTVACYAAPPPDINPVVFTECIFIVQAPADVFTNDALLIDNQVAYYENLKAFRLCTPASELLVSDFVFKSNHHSFEKNQLNCNFSYPFGANF